jgi:hypothetical protein
MTTGTRAWSFSNGESLRIQAPLQLAGAFFPKKEAARLSVTVLTSLPGCDRVFAMWRANFFMANAACCDNQDYS